MLIVGFAAAVVGAYGPMLGSSSFSQYQSKMAENSCQTCETGPGFVPISQQLGITVSTLSQATAWLILTIGLSVFLINPVAKMYGKRPVYIAAVVLLFVVSIWGAVADNYGSFLGSRILGGIGELECTSTQRWMETDVVDRHGSV